MSKLDLNSPADFARATLGDVGAVLQLFTGRDEKEWDIQESSYNGVVFHVFESKQVYNGALSQVNDSGGRRKVKYLFPYQDGQTTDDLGRTPETFSLNVVLHGKNYLQGFASLFNELQKPNPGTLIHPIRGPIRCVMESFNITHSSEMRKAMTIQLVFLEHNFDIGAFQAKDDNSSKSALAKTLEAFQKVETVLANVQGTVIFANNVKTRISNLLENFNSNLAVTLTKMNKLFNGGSSADIPFLLPLNEGGTDNDTAQIVAAPNDPFLAVPTDEITDIPENEAVAIEAIKKEVNTRRDEVNDIIDELESGGENSSIVFHDDVLAMKEVAILIQDALEKGIQSSQSKIIDYVTPRLMSIREIAFENGLSVDQSNEIEMLNKALLSVNYIVQGTTIKVPLS